MLHCSITKDTSATDRVKYKMRGNMDHQTIVIKKYENRRLYDTTESRYVNLDEVAQMVREGKDVKVKDAVTGEDLTRLVLTQIIVERAKAADSDFPVDVLRQMVVASGRATQETMLKYMKAAVDMYQDAYRAISPTLSLSDFIPPPSASRATSMQTPPVARAEEATPELSTTHRAKDETAKVEALRRRLEELESLVSNLGAEKGSRKRKTNSRRHS
jgi:polyhydroxyalkanoate synthesis repressor PhaR